MLLSADMNYAIEQLTANPEFHISKETLILFGTITVMPLIVELLIRSIMKYPMIISWWIEYIILVVANFIVGEIILLDAEPLILYTGLLLIDWLIHIMIRRT